MGVHSPEGLPVHGSRVRSYNIIFPKDESCTRVRAPKKEKTRQNCICKLPAGLLSRHALRRDEEGVKENKFVQLFTPQFSHSPTVGPCGFEQRSRSPPTSVKGDSTHGIPKGLYLSMELGMAKMHKMQDRGRLAYLLSCVKTRVSMMDGEWGPMSNVYAHHSELCTSLLCSARSRSAEPRPRRIRPAPHAPIMAPVSKPMCPDCGALPLHTFTFPTDVATGQRTRSGGSSGGGLARTDREGGHDGRGRDLGEDAAEAATMGHPRVPLHQAHQVTSRVRYLQFKFRRAAEQISNSKLWYRPPSLTLSKSTGTTRLLGPQCVVLTFTK